MILTVRCPNCFKKMKYEPRKTTENKVKKCVYCGKSFSVNLNNIEGL
ncbi:MAG: hypothetical protein AB7V77_03700 [Candidatus Woesearchaeota archaeon]